jgi:hypothetical protein
VGALAHFLKNRFYIGEVVYRGETHSGEHASIIDRPTFEAVQVKLANNARARRVRIESSPAILMGRIFDDRGNRRRAGIIDLHYRHQPALDCASISFRQRSSASARHQADAQTGDPRRHSPLHSQGARLD